MNIINKITLIDEQTLKKFFNLVNSVLGVFGLESKVCYLVN